ncbi:MAG: TRP75-related protein [Ehrlichia sp.]
MVRRNISCILLALVLFLVVSCSNKSGYKFSRRYSPIYNPGGEAFNNNSEFASAYSVYKQRRDALVSGVKKKSSNRKSDVQRETGRIIRVEDIDQLVDEALSKGQDDDLMIDSNGINLANVLGARFVDSNGSVGDIYSDTKIGGISGSEIVNNAESIDKLPDIGGDKGPGVIGNKRAVVVKDVDGAKLSSHAKEYKKA